MKPRKGGLACVSSFVKEQREQYGDGVVLMDNGGYFTRTAHCLLLQLHRYNFCSCNFSDAELYEIRCRYYGKS